MWSHATLTASSVRSWWVSPSRLVLRRCAAVWLLLFVWWLLARLPRRLTAELVVMAFSFGPGDAFSLICEAVLALYNPRRRSFALCNHNTGAY